MFVIHARNVHCALPEALRALEIMGVRRDSRNGPVVMFPTPVTTVYGRPTERVMFWADRDANPFFHLIESLWMLAGRNDVDTLARYVQRMRSYSDDGVTLHGAYGHRWRVHFGRDQLTPIIEALKANPDDRRQVLSMWDARADLGRAGKDLPCNLQAIFQINSAGELDMMVTNRSNDLIWGAYGANAVHFSYLQEYVATAVGVPVGTYRQVSANFHAYVEVLEKVKHLALYARDPHDPPYTAHDPYLESAATLGVQPFPLMSVPREQWDEELLVWLDDPDAMGMTDPFWRRVASPMRRAHEALRDRANPGRFADAADCLAGMASCDWKIAALEYVARREAAHLRAVADGPTNY